MIPDMYGYVTLRMVALVFHHFLSYHGVIFGTNRASGRTTYEKPRLNLVGGVSSEESKGFIFSAVAIISVACD